MKKISVGGQALIGGIMMKSPETTAMAVHTPDKSIDIEYIEEKHLKDKFSFFGWPVIRGVVNFIESMILGYKTLMMSADKSGMTDLEEEEEKKRKAEKAAKKRAKLIAKGKIPADEPVEETTEEEPEKDKKSSTSPVIMAVMVIGVVLGVALALVLFMWLPTAIFNGVNGIFKGAIPNTFRPLIEGVLKIAIFVGYVALTSLTKDIKRVFMYHGAEHKTIFCLENELELTVENVRKQSRFHPRCGTSFMILMLVVGILVNLLIVTFFPGITKFTAVWVLIKLLMVPLICGIGYELIKICGKHDNTVTRIISAPGMWVQRLTTKEPEDDMIEVAIASLKAVLPSDIEGVEIDGCCADIQ